MMRLKIAYAAAALLLSATAAQADGWYFSALGGPTFDPHLSVGGSPASPDTGFNAGGRLGTSIGASNFSVDADTLYNQSDLSGGGRISSWSFMGDLLYHVDTGLPFGIYGGGGVGAVRTGYSAPAVSGGGTVLGWQLIGGTEFPVSPGASLFAEYRYQNARDINIGTVTGIGNTSNNLSVGVKFNL